MVLLIALNVLFLLLLPIPARLIITRVRSPRLRAIALFALATLSVFQTPFIFPHEGLVARCFFVCLPWLHALRLVDLARNPARAQMLARDAWGFAAWMNLSAEGTTGAFKLLLLSTFRSFWPLSPAQWADLYSQASTLHRHLLAAAFCVALYLWIGGLADLISAVAEPTLRVRIPHVFDNPHLATSLRGFWGRRWNRPFQDALKRTIVVQERSTDGGSSQVVPATPAQALGVFLVSGLFHDVINYRCFDVCSLRTTVFFALQAGGCVAEGLWSRRRHRPSGIYGRLNAVLRWAAVMAFLTATGPLFVGPYYKLGAMAVLPVPSALDIGTWQTLAATK
ncbi:hypothetical protein HDU89_006218 [Geranomyces variabilis]|nr:hypothetical protein HDU89_006218 [Geranomyces variabilis]